MLKIGVLGYGYWGPNIVRNFVEIPTAEVVMVCDQNPRQLERVVARYPAIQTTTRHDELINHPDIDAIAIVTPVSTHFKLAMAALEAGKHVWVEKPMTSTVAEAEQLIAEAEKRNLNLHVDHTFVYTGAVRKIQQLVSAGELGDIYYYDSTRVNLGLFQFDVNVIWDLAVHDLSIIEYIFSQKPTAVSATGISHVQGQQENVAYLTLYFDEAMIAHINVNWLAPVKIRQTLIGGSKKMIVFDDLQPSEKIKIYDKGITLNKTAEEVYDILIGYRTGDMWSPKLDAIEALREEALHFVDCIEKGEPTMTDGYAGLRVVKVLEAATQSIKQRGESVKLKE